MTAVQSIIKYSIIVENLRVLKLHGEHYRNLCLAQSAILYEVPNISASIKEVEGKILELNRIIKSLLEPLLQGNNFGYTDNWAVPVKDMQRGYILLSNDPFGKYEFTHVLFLNNYGDKTNVVPAGTLRDYIKVVSILGNIKPVYKNSLESRNNMISILKSQNIKRT